MPKCLTWPTVYRQTNHKKVAIASLIGIHVVSHVGGILCTVVALTESRNSDADVIWNLCAYLVQFVFFLTPVVIILVCFVYTVYRLPRIRAKVHAPPGFAGKYQH